MQVLLWHCTKHSIARCNDMGNNRMDIDISLVARLVAEQLPQWAHLPIRAVEPGGWDNKTFRLGETISLRFPSAKRYTAQVDKEHKWLSHLAPQLPLPIPIPLAMGQPGKGYPWHWSVYQWLEGENATVGPIENLNQFAAKLAHFLTALRKIDSTGGPLPGPHNFFRGGLLTIYDAETRDAISCLRSQINTEAATAVWESAIASTWQKAPVWLHGDIHTTNLLVREGCLSAVIDFGCLGIGDPACDYAIAWTLFSGESRKTFRTLLSADDATWVRSRGWALWKSLTTLVKSLNTAPLAADTAQQTIAAIINDYSSTKDK